MGETRHKQNLKREEKEGKKGSWSWVDCPGLDPEVRMRGEGGGPAPIPLSIIED